MLESFRHLHGIVFGVPVLVANANPASQWTAGLIIFCSVAITGCDRGTGPSRTLPGAEHSATSNGSFSASESALGEKLIGEWRMLEDEHHPRHDPPVETVEFTKDGRFISYMNGKEEMSGRFQIEGDSLIFLNADGEIHIAQQTIKSLTDRSLVVTDSGGGQIQFVRKNR